ncbi:unnamed protein product [Symbiodinium natans]|uniref:Uncharacterized protein n=1 Tax=Symbiodinium natans TaxID=878477 RepID=A0A812R2T2_9DINO|nr:unnamed protein product [Symbiodinium natans]
MDRSTDEEVVAVAKHEASPKQEQGFGIDVKQRQSQVHRRGKWLSPEFGRQEMRVHNCHSSVVRNQEVLPNEPFLDPPRYREFIVNVPGDAGFDPFCLAKDLATFKWMQEAELKHARVAMLATVLWPLSELDLSALKLPFLDLSGTTLDGAPMGMFFGTVSLGVAIMELSKAPESPPGFYSFDPLSLKDFEMPMACWLPQGRRWTAEAELKHGRLAMLAALAFAFTELTTKVPIIRQAPFHFN